NISSVVGVTGNAGQANYAASKAGVIGLTKSVSKELAGRKVTCNAIAPGFIETDMTAALSEDQRSDLLAGIPLGRIGMAADIAALTAFLAGPAGGYITGQTLVVDGGLSL
ncbi:MAG: SDR family oxidoreductase, partial [Roseibacillus sp.]|nr:SDR family oxidoreductase [Roseibacillus sp.]